MLQMLHLYTGHISPNCKVVQCLLEACRNITPENAAKVKAAWEKKQVTMHVAVVFEESDEEDYFEDCGEEGEGDEYIDVILSCLNEQPNKQTLG